MGLAGEHQLDRPLLVREEAGEAVLVGEDHPGPLVGREAAGEADRRRDQRVRELLERARLAVARELGSQPAAREDRELALLAEMAAHSSAGDG